MQRTHFDHMACSVARTLDIVGEWWTLLILRDIFYGIGRFDVLRRHLGISRKVLTSRLKTLVDNEILMRVRYQRKPDRYEYRLTDRGKELFPVIVSLMSWGDKWLAENGEPPVLLVDRETGEPLEPLLVSADNGLEIRWETAEARPGSAKYEEAWAALQEAIEASHA
jgi:DNA-binding HxlR family transcriptional regulator